MSDIREIVKSQADSIIAMVAALECDYDRFEELRDSRGLAAGTNAHELAEWELMDGDELKELEKAAGECESRDDAEQRIQEDALSVQVRGDWRDPGDSSGDVPTEFELLLCTGEPATRIRGELDGGMPRRAWLEVQDWGTPWTQYFDIEQDTLLTYARCFYFGEG